MHTKEPLVSIGLPVFNGEKYLEKAISSALDQSVSHLELIICDNASSDSTEEICRKYAHLDSRVRYYRRYENQGASANFNWSLELARGRYFKWLAADDYMLPDFIGTCSALLDRNAEAVLAYPRVDVVDSNDQRVETHYKYSEFDLSSNKASIRIKELLTHLPTIAVIFGLIRREILQSSPAIRPCIGADYCLLFDLALRGPFIATNKVSLVGRHHEESYGVRTTAGGASTIKWQQRWYASDKRHLYLPPTCRRIFEYVRATLNSNLNVTEKFEIMGFLARHLRWSIATIADESKELFKTPAMSLTQK